MNLIDTYLIRWIITYLCSRLPWVIINIWHDWLYFVLSPLAFTTYSGGFSPLLLPIQLSHSGSNVAQSLSLLYSSHLLSDFLFEREILNPIYVMKICQFMDLPQGPTLDLYLYLPHDLSTWISNNILDSVTLVNSPVNVNLITRSHSDQTFHFLNPTSLTGLSPQELARAVTHCTPGLSCSVLTYSHVLIFSPS